MMKIKEKGKQIIVPKVGDIVKGRVIAKEKAAVFLDLGILGTGIIYGKEFYEARNELKNVNIGDLISAKVIDSDNEDGYVDLSLNKAQKEIAWSQISEKKENKEIFTVKILGANKGGLMTRVLGITSFIPVSQLSSEHYPKVEGGDTQKILRHLQKFIGKDLQVRVLDFNPKEESLILSEKLIEIEEIKKELEKYKVGDIVEVEITGIADFGVFVKILNKEGKDIEGLIHISELSWQLINSPADVVRIGEKLKAKIVDITEEKVSLSIKALEEDPWKKIENKYKIGDIIEGRVKKIDSFGALIEVAPKVQGLCHISEFGSFEKMEKILKLEEIYKFKISQFEPNNHRMILEILEKEKEENKGNTKEDNKTE